MRIVAKELFYDTTMELSCQYWHWIRWDFYDWIMKTTQQWLQLTGWMMRTNNKKKLLRKVEDPGFLLNDRGW